MWFRFFLVSVLTFLSTVSSAADAIEQTSENLHWRCWYDQRSHISCLVDVLPAANDEPQLHLPFNLPSIVREMRTNPIAFRGRFIHIPLLGQPQDMAFTAALAKASVCGSRQDCTVYFTGTLPSLGEMMALLNKHFPNQDEATMVALLGNALNGVN
jgi:hypothetical protein